MKRFFIAAAFLCAASISAFSQTARELLAEDPHLAYGNLYPYQPMDTLSSEAPDGYKAFYISHFGRHGSRFATDSMEVVRIASQLERFHDRGLLTPKGEQLRSDVKLLADRSAGHYGALTEIGAAEHKGIARRLYKHYGEVFAGKKNVDTYTTMVQRVIDSRDNFLSVLSAADPKLEFKLNYSDDSQRNYREVLGDNPSREQNELLRRDVLSAPVREKEWSSFDGGDFARAIFTDPAQAGDVKRFMSSLMSATKSASCIGPDMPDFTTYYTPDELYHVWWRINFGWYTSHGVTEDNKGARADSKGRGITECIIEDADNVIEGRNDVPATLRFSHDGDFNAMISFMNLEGANSADLENIAEEFRDFENVRAAVNLQMVFYRNAAGSVLVKILKNEKETLIAGLKPSYGNYYDWNEVKAYWKGRTF